jgi:hypothetical protein
MKGTYSYQLPVCDYSVPLLEENIRLKNRHKISISFCKQVQRDLMLRASIVIRRKEKSEYKAP